MGVWLVIFLVFTAQSQIGTASWKQAAMLSLGRWGPWMILTPCVLWLVRRFPISGEKRWRHALVHLFMSVSISILSHVLNDYALSPSHPREAVVHSGMGQPPPRRRPPPHFDGERPPPPRGSERPPPPREEPRPQRSFFGKWTGRLYVNLPIYWSLFGIQSVLLAGAQLRERERQSLELQSKLTQAHLDTLKLQLQPHFLFNALNATSTLVHRDPDKADEMIGHLSTLLRGVLEERDANVVTLSRELDLLTAYVSIEQVRFGDRVQFVQDIAPEALQAKVPTLLLQPIVENAVRHGLEPLGKPGHVWVSAWKERGHLRIEISDDGVGRQGTGRQGWGIGLSNAEARLEA
ncbi:MAG: sensor histidine kinase, partial [Verrucomicrobiales bacterium]